MSEIVFNFPKENSPTVYPSTTAGDLQTQVESLQTTLASLNQRVYILQETLQERDQEIADLEMRLVQGNQGVPSTPNDIPSTQAELHSDKTLTIIGILINLYKFVFPPGKESPVQSV